MFLNHHRTVRKEAVGEGNTGAFLNSYLVHLMRNLAVII